MITLILTAIAILVAIAVIIALVIAAALNEQPREPREPDQFPTTPEELIGIGSMFFMD